MKQAGVIYTALALALVIAKAMGLLSWPWWGILAPLWVPVAVPVLGILLALAIVAKLLILGLAALLVIAIIVGVFEAFD